MRRSTKNPSLVLETYLSAKKFVSGQKVILDSQIEVEVKFQRILKNFTTVYIEGKPVEVRTERLTEIPDKINSESKPDY